MECYTDLQVHINNNNNKIKIKTVTMHYFMNYHDHHNNNYSNLLTYKVHKFGTFLHVYYYYERAKNQVKLL